MSFFMWQGREEECRIKQVEIFVLIDGNHFECRGFHVTFSRVADAKDFLMSLDKRLFKTMLIEQSGRLLHLEPISPETCRRAIHHLQSYEFPYDSVNEALETLHLLPGSHWFDTSKFMLGRALF